MKGLKPLFSEATPEWPKDLYAALDKEFHFDFDPCQPNVVWDGLAADWTGKRVYCNPPYGRHVWKWIAKATEADVAVYLLPARTDTAWFHDYGLKANEIRFFRGRLRFNKDHRIEPRYDDNAAPFPSLLLVFRK